MSFVRASMCAVLLAACVPKAAIVETTRYPQLAAACECSMRAARDETMGALAGADRRTSATVPHTRVDDCVAGVAGLAAIPAATPTDTGFGFDSIASLLRDMDAGDIPLAIDPRGFAVARCDAADERLEELRVRLGMFASAWRESLYASQVCHGLALMVALEAEIDGSERARARERALVTAASRNGRHADAYAAMGVALVAALESAAARRTTPDAFLRLANGLAGVSIEGGFDDDAERAWTAAVAHARDPELARLVRGQAPARGGDLDVPPVSAAAAPTLEELFGARDTTARAAAVVGLTGLWRGDLGAVARGAVALHAERAAPSIELAGATLLVDGKPLEALAQTVALVPFYTDAGKAIAAFEPVLQKPKKPKRRK
jgi:hypothetical protein